MPNQKKVEYRICQNPACKRPEYKVRSPWQKFCSNECRLEDWQAKNPRNTNPVLHTIYVREMATCRWCWNEFPKIYAWQELCGECLEIVASASHKLTRHEAMTAIESAKSTPPSAGAEVKTSQLIEKVDEFAESE